MAVTITNSELAVAIRAAASEDDIAAPVAKVIGFLAPAAAAMVLDYAPDAPDPMHNAGVIRLAGWLFDADPTDPAVGRALQVSGAGPLLSRWRKHRAGAIGSAASTTPQPTPGSGLPPLPGEGSFILTVKDGVLAWVQFPLPS